MSERARLRCRQGTRAVLRKRAKRSPDREGGFTLIELLIVVAVTPLIVGALGIGLVTVFSLQNGTTARLQDSSDAQVVTSTFIKDVQSATSITTSSTATPQCGSGTQLLGLQWGSGQVVSYTEVSQGSGTYSLDRNYCLTSTAGASTTIIAYDMSPPCPSASTCQLPPVVYEGTALDTAPSSGYVTTTGISKVSFPITEPKSSYAYTLAATPASGDSSAASVLGAPTSGPTCGFALPNTGTYASTLCFVGFTTSIIQAAEATTVGSLCSPGTTGTNVSVAVPGGYTMSFCLTVKLGNSSDSVVASAFPTYGQAFLGNDNNGTPFYTGVGCANTDPTTTDVNGVVEGTPSCIDPAIYQQTSGATDTVTASNIVVTAPGGGDATNYEVVTADAETTDPTESITWTSSLPVSPGTPLTFTQLPDSTSSALGDACNETTVTGAAGQNVDNGLGLTGLGTDQVECTSTWDATVVRTGTAILEVSPPIMSNGLTQPVTISAALHGQGLEGVAFGLLLP